MVSEKERENEQHTLPRWVNWVQQHLFLSCLILAEAYLLGTLMTLGWVANIQQPASWGWYDAIGVLLFFMAGAMAAGIALQCSVKASSCFSQGKWGMGAFNFLGVIAFAGCEIWASLSERSANLRPTPADSAVLHMLGITNAPVSPTIVIVALLLPFSTLYFGFSQQNKAIQETADERVLREANEIASAKHKAELAVVKARGRRQQIAAYLAKEPEPSDNPPPDDNESGEGPTSVASGAPFPTENTSGLAGENVTTSDDKSDASTRANVRDLSSGMWTAHDLKQYVLMRYNITLSQTEASRAIAGLPERTKAEGVRGQPYCAPKRAVKGWADKRFASANAPQANAE